MRNPFKRREKALSASSGVLEALRDRSWNPYRSLGGTNTQRIAGAYQRGIDASYGWIYATQPAARSVIDYIARNTAQLGLKLYERVGDTERVRREDHAAAESMRDPNGVTPSDAFIYRLVTDYLIWDNAYFAKFREKGTQKLVFERMPPNMVTVEGGRFKAEAYWFWRTDGSWFGPIPPEDVFHWYGYNPEDPLLGLSRLETLRQELATDRAVQTTLVELAKSGLKTGYIQRPLEAPSWDQAAAERFAEQWRAQKVRADGRDPILDEGMTYETAGISPKDAEILASRQFTRGEVAREYGMEHCPPEDEEERLAFYADVLAPLCKSLSKQLDLSILRAEYGEDDFYWELDLNEKLRGQPEKRFQAITSAVGRPWMLVEEARAFENLKQVEGGDELTIPLNVALGSLPAPNVMPPQNALGPPQDGSHREAALESGEHKALEVTTRPRRVADMNRQKRYIDETRAALESYYRHQASSLKSAKSQPANSERWNARLTAVLAALLKGIVEKEGGLYAARLGADDFDVRQVDHYVKAMAEGTAEGLNGATQRDIEEMGVVLALERAKGLRAEVAASNIGARVTVFARKEAAKQSPEPERRNMTWVANTERHADLNGKSVPLGADWGGIEPGSEPNCACSAVIS